MGSVRIMMVPCTRFGGAPISAKPQPRLGCSIAFTALEPEPMEATRQGILLGCRGHGGGNTPASLLGAHLHILKLAWIREGKVRMSERLFVLPRDQIEAVALLQTGQPEDRLNPLQVIVYQSPNQEALRRFKLIRDVSTEVHSTEVHSLSPEL
jgi:hypothetical protein